MNENIFNSNDLVGSENRQKRYSVPASPKGMMPRTPRTPLMDVKNRWRSQPRSRMSTRRVKTTDNRMDVLDEGLLDYTPRKVKIFKQPNDGEWIEHAADDASELVQPCTASNFEDENVLQENLNHIIRMKCTNEISVVDDSLKTGSSVSDSNQDTPSPVESTHTVNTSFVSEENTTNFSLQLDELSKSFDFEISEETLAVLANADSLGDLGDEFLTYDKEELCESEEGDIVDPDEVISQLWELIGETHEDFQTTNQDTELAVVDTEESESPLNHLPEISPRFSDDHDIGTAGEVISTFESPHKNLSLNEEPRTIILGVRSSSLELALDTVDKSEGLELFFVDKTEPAVVSTAVNLSACDLAEGIVEMISDGEFMAETLNEETTTIITAMSTDDFPPTRFCGAEYFPAGVSSVGKLTLDRSKLVEHDLNVSGDNKLATEGLESSLNSLILEHAEALNFFEPSEEILKFIDEFLKDGSTLESGIKELSIDDEHSVEEENDQSSPSMKNDDERDKSIDEQLIGYCDKNEELSHSTSGEILTNAEETTGTESWTAFAELVKVNKKVSCVKRRSYSTKISRVLESLREACGSVDPSVEMSACPEQSEIPKSFTYSQLLAAESREHAAAAVKSHIEITAHETSDSNLKRVPSILENETQASKDFECTHETISFSEQQKGLKSPMEFLQHTANDNNCPPSKEGGIDTFNVSEAVMGDQETFPCKSTIPKKSEEFLARVDFQTPSPAKCSELLVNTGIATSDFSIIDEGNETEPSSDKSGILPVSRHSNEIKSLESQMLEMKRKVEHLESQVQLNPGDVDQSTKKGCDWPDLSKIESLEVELREERLLVSDLQVRLDGRKKRVEQLEAQLAEAHLKCENLEGQVTEVEKRCSALEKEHLTAELNFAKELQRLKSQYAQNVCHEREALEESSQEICEEFDGMLSEVERLTILQGKLKDMLNRVMRTTNESLTGYTKLLKDYSTLQQNHNTVKTQLSTVETENKQLNEDVQVLENLLQRSNDSLGDLRQLYLEADQTSQAKVENLSSKVSSLSEALEKATQEKTRLETGLEDYSAKFQQSLDLLETECQASQDELKDTAFLLEHKKQINQTLKGEVCELRKVKADWEMGKTLIKELQDSISFLNEEREATILEHNSELEVVMSQVTMLKEEVESLITANREYQNSQDLLQTEVSGLREELYITKSDVTSLLSSLEQVECRADSVLETLHHKFGFDLSSDSFKATPNHLSVSHSSQPPTSLVAQVLSMAGGSSIQPPNNLGSKQQHSTHSTTKAKQFLRQSNVEYGSCSKKKVPSAQDGQNFPVIKTRSSPSKGPSSRKALRFSSPHAETRGREKTINTAATDSINQPPELSRDNEDDDGLNTSVPGFAHIRSIPLSGETGENGSSVMVSDGSTDLNVVDICENLVVAIEEKFSLILKIAHVADRASRKSIKELRGEVDALTEKVQMKQRQLERAEAEVEGKSHALEESRDEVDQLNERVNSMIQAILKHEDLTYDVKRLEEDNSELKQEISNLKGEKDMLSAHVQKLIIKVNGGEDVQSSLKRIVALEKKNYDLHCFLFQEKEKNKEKGEKAMRRIRVLEMNWKRAEAEVCKFDELVEAVRDTCIKSRSVHSHPALLHIRRLIDGLVEAGQKSSDKEDRLSTAAPPQSSRLSTAAPSQSSMKSSERQEFRV